MSPIYTRLGKYEIVRKLGRGGMADVYLALDTEMDRQVALKLIETSSNRDQDTIEAERRGAALQAMLAGIDSRVAAVHEYDELDGHFYIDMEYVEGEDLSEILRKGSLHLSRVVKIAIEICDMLAQAHAFNVVIEGKEIEGIVHGDIKPRNVRINASDQVKVLDFGIAKALSRTRKLTRNEFGSVAYSSPERLESGDVDVHSDLWSVGVLLYEMVTSIQPYRADSTGKLERLIRDRVPPAPLPADCPQALKKVILKTLAPAIDRRYQSAAQIKADLEAFQDGLETKAELELDSEATRRTQPSVLAGDTDDRTRRTTQTPPSAQSPQSSAKQRVRPCFSQKKNYPPRRSSCSGVTVAMAGQRRDWGLEKGLSAPGQHRLRASHKPEGSLEPVSAVGFSQLRASRIDRSSQVPQAEVRCRCRACDRRLPE